MFPFEIPCFSVFASHWFPQGNSYRKDIVYILVWVFGQDCVERTSSPLKFSSFTGYCCSLKVLSLLNCRTEDIAGLACRTTFEGLVAGCATLPRSLPLLSWVWRWCQVQHTVQYTFHGMDCRLFKANWIYPNPFHIGSQVRVSKQPLG